LSEAQKRIALDKHQFRVVCCGRRFGKTTSAVLELIGRAMSVSDSQVAYIATTHQQSRDIAWGMLKKIVEKAIIKVNDTRLELTVRTVDGGSSAIWLRGWESVETLRGNHFDFIVIDEIASMKHWKYNWNEVLLPTLTDTGGHVLFISTPRGFNHFYDLYNMYLDHPDEYASFKFSSYDNPYIKHTEIDKFRKQMTDDAFAQEYLAEFKTYTGLVYKEWNRDVHVISPEDAPPLDDMTHYRYIDFGFTNPAAVGFIAMDGDNNWYVYDEIYKSQLTIPNLFERIMQKSSGRYFTETFADCNAAGDIEQLERMGLYVTPVVKQTYGTNENYNSYKHSLIQEQLKVQEGSGKPKLFVFKNCKYHIKEFESYSYKDVSGDENYREQAEKKHDHLMDGIGYLATSLYNANKKKHKHRSKYI
jgi:hypothetical protein